MSRICLLEPYDTGSHRAWLRGYAAHSQHTVIPLTLAGRFWKWRMHGGAVSLERLYREADVMPDLILATDMVDLTTFLALTRDITHDVPVALYMHENQLTYPPRPGEKRDLHYAFINYASMLCADAIYFNSQYHLDAWLDELPRLLKHFPDYREMDSLARLEERSEVLPLGLSLGRLDVPRDHAADDGPLLIVWNHRWEYDKGPATLVRAMRALKDRGVPFRLALLGERFVGIPAAFEALPELLGDALVQYGYVERYEDYARWLWRSDVVVSTAIQEFFGAAVAEAMYCDCVPLLPDRLAYPQFVPKRWRDICLYETDQDLADRLAWMAANLSQVRSLTFRDRVQPLDWPHMAPVYDQRFQTLIDRRQPADSTTNDGAGSSLR